MQKWFFIAAFSMVAHCVHAQQHFLEKGEITPCNYKGKFYFFPNNTVSVMFNEETNINSHICGKVVSVFKVGDNTVVLVKTSDDVYVGFGNLKQAFMKKGDDVQMQSPIGLPLPGNSPGTWKLELTYDMPEASLPCEKAIEMIRLSQPNSIVFQEVTEK